MRTKFTHCLTLRIVPEMDALIADAAYDSRITSKAAWIRWAITRSLRQGATGKKMCGDKGRHGQE
jgi:hypothetical protein